MAKNRKTPDMNLPVWFDGQNINEALFCEEFLHERRIIFANGAFFTPDGRVTDDLPLRGEIYDKLKFCAVNNIPRKITNILEVLKLEAQVPDFPPEQDRIHVFNGTLLLNGTFTEGRSAIVRSRLPVVYNPDAPAPVIWLNFLNGLLHAEDIPTLQEFIGYCLIPSNKGQRMMVIKGNGGEGKSQIGAVLSAIFGTNMKDGSIGKISENRFARADLEHILLCVDDDMRMEALRQTNYVKSIVTAQGKMDLERKGTLLDIGAGMGAYSVEFARRCASVTALDMDEDCLSVLRSRAAQCSLSNIRCINVPWEEYRESEKFDVTFSAMCPAICNQEELLRLESLTKRTACLLTVTRGSYEKCRMELMRQLPLKKSGGMVTEALHYYNVLYLMGRQPNIECWSEHFTTSASVESLVDRYAVYLKLFGVEESESVPFMRDFFEAKAVEGMVEDECQMYYALVYWNVPKNEKG